VIDVPPLMVAGLLALGGAVLVRAGPSWVVRWRFLTRVPRAAVVLWQAGALAALGCVFGVAWILIREAVTAEPVGWWVWGLTGAVTVFAAVVVVRLVWALGRVIIATGSRRRRHRDLVDLLGREDECGVDGRTRGLRVLAEERPLAYCVPGLRDPRVVLSAGTVAMLSPDELAAVLAHERAHLRARHDLVLATFDAVHQAFPHAIRSELPAEQCRLLVEMLADDAAVRSVGPAPLGRALVALAGSVVPAGGLGAGPLSTRVRLERLAAPEHGRTGRLAAAVYLLAVSLVLAPVLAVVVTAS
jgi:Zn-dependent protease with chaperone function